MGTDGLPDNVFDEETAALVTLLKEQGHSCHTVAEGLAKLAMSHAGHSLYDTPYAKGSRETGGSHVGGKTHDVTVLVAYVSASEARPQDLRFGSLDLLA